MSNITVPMPPPPRQISVDHPTPLFHIKYIGSPPPYVSYRKNCRTITLYNPKTITFNPYQKQTIYFPIQVETSLMGYTIIYGSDLLFLKGLQTKLSIQLTNDFFLSTKVYNNTNQFCTFPPNSLTFTCITIAPINYT